MSSKKQLIVMGIRGVPAAHGGFETFAEKLCPFLVRRGWEVTVYCQEEGNGKVYESDWEGVTRIHIPVGGDGALASVIFDFRAVLHSLSRKGLILTLGYNTAIFNILHRVFTRYNYINMDGIEWKRQKWGSVAKSWFWLNERFGCWFGNHLIADHPKIKEHLSRNTNPEKITMIPYGADEVTGADDSLLSEFGVQQESFGVVIARPEPENSILEVVEGFLNSKSVRDKKLVVLGKFSPDSNEYHKAVLNAASGCNNIIFPGAIYDQQIVNALRFFSRFYVHGHQVGGTNPSLVEAIGAGCAIIAHDNEFNRWVAKDGAVYFSDVPQMSDCVDRLFTEQDQWEGMRKFSVENFQQRFRWDMILEEYEALLSK